MAGAKYDQTGLFPQWHTSESNHNIRVPFEFRQPWAMICFFIVIFVNKIGHIHVSGSKKFYRGCVGEMTPSTEGIMVVS